MITLNKELIHKAFVNRYQCKDSDVVVKEIVKPQTDIIDCRADSYYIGFCESPNETSSSEPAILDTNLFLGQNFIPHQVFFIGYEISSPYIRIEKMYKYDGGIEQAQREGKI